MKIFLSWSQDYSKEVAQEFRDWLPVVNQKIKPFMSSTDIELGTEWGVEIKSRLKESSIGIIFVTSDNLTSPWVNFEVGALSFALENTKVIPVLLDVESVGKSPLNQYQSAMKFCREDIFRLITTINNSLNDEKLSESVVQRSFDRFWPDLESKFNEISEKHKKGSSPLKKKSTNEYLETIDEKLDYYVKVIELMNRNIKRVMMDKNDQRLLEISKEQYFNVQTLLERAWRLTDHITDGPREEMKEVLRVMRVNLLDRRDILKYSSEFNDSVDINGGNPRLK